VHAGEAVAGESLGGGSGGGPDVRTDDEPLDYIHKTHNTVYHPSCTVRMGADADPSAPLDAWLRVKGVEGLRVADGSVMPDLIAVNPCITTMMIGEKCADLVKEDAEVCCPGATACSAPAF
jgi:choline dehydrogenase